MVKVGDVVRVLVDKPCSSYFMKGDIVTVVAVDNSNSDGMVTGYTKERGKSGTNYCYLKHVEITARKGKMIKNIWEVIVINKDTDEIIIREIVIDGDEKSACSKVGISFADKLKNIVFDNLCFVTKNIGSYDKKEK